MLESRDAVGRGRARGPGPTGQTDCDFYLGSEEAPPQGFSRVGRPRASSQVIPKLNPANAATCLPLAVRVLTLRGVCVAGFPGTRHTEGWSVSELLSS